jgi:hypothetical protein
VPYQDEPLKYKLYIHPIWDWVTDLLQDSQIAPHFVWDAERLYKFDSTTFVHFIHEPWTADSFWDVQVCT